VAEQSGCAVGVVYRAGSVPLGQWIDMAFHVRWSAQGDGLFEWWVNGVKKASWTGPTLYYYANNGVDGAGAGQAYLQHGYYRPANQTTHRPGLPRRHDDRPHRRQHRRKPQLRPIV